MLGVNTAPIKIVHSNSKKSLYGNSSSEDEHQPPMGLLTTPAQPNKNAVQSTKPILLTERVSKKAEFQPIISFKEIPSQELIDNPSLFQSLNVSAVKPITQSMQPNTKQPHKQDNEPSKPTLLNLPPARSIHQSRQRNDRQFSRQAFELSSLKNQRETLKAQQDTLPLIDRQPRQSKVNSFIGVESKVNRSRALPTLGASFNRYEPPERQNTFGNVVPSLSTPAPFSILPACYVRHGSMKIELVERSLRYIESLERQLASRSDRLSMLDSLQVIKFKMESYLSSQINLQNMPQQLPASTWSQTELTNFYTNLYRPVLLSMAQPSDPKQPITLKKYKNCVYFGPMVAGKKEGQGVIHYFQGRFFEGIWKQDQKIKGIEVLQGEFYLGPFSKNGNRSGQAILKTNSHLLAGSFDEGQFQVHDCRGPNILNRHGLCIKFDQAVFFDREMVTIKNAEDSLFIGNINQSEEKEGEGLEIFSNGDLYVGSYSSGVPEGYGQYYWENGAYYRGQFLSGMRHGRGKWQVQLGDSYEGEYMNDKKNGQGEYIWKNGARYVGAFENDYRHGYGEMHWQDGRSYRGKWVNGIESETQIKVSEGRASSDRYSLHEGRRTGAGNRYATDRSKKVPSLEVQRGVRNQRTNLTVQHQTLKPPSRSQHSSKLPFRTLVADPRRKQIPVEQLKSIYNPSFQWD